MFEAGRPLWSRGAPFLFGLALACGSPEASFLARYGQTAIIVVHDGYRRAITVVGQPGPITSEGERVQALFYPSSASALRLSEGLQVETEVGQPLPAPEAIWEVSAAEPSWRPLDALPIELGDVRLPVLSTCVALEPRSYSTPGIDGGQLRFAVRADGDRALLAVGSDYYLADAERVVPVPPMGLPVGTAYWDAGRQVIWLFEAGRAMRGTIAHGFEPAPALPFVPWWIDGNPHPDRPEELFAVTASAAIWRYFEGAWSQVSPPRGPQVEDTRLTIAWGGLNEAYVTGLGFDKLLEHRPGGDRLVTIDDVRAGVGDAFYLARYLPGWGPLLGTRGGHLYRQDGGVWRTLVQPPTTSKVFLIEALGDGLLFGGEDGVVNQLQPPNLLCPPENYGSFSDQSALGLFDLGDALLYVVPSPPGVDLRLNVLRRR